MKNKKINKRGAFGRLGKVGEPVMNFHLTFSFFNRFIINGGSAFKGVGFSCHLFEVCLEGRIKYLFLYLMSWLY